ncbi:peptidoglycan editing factor PgeF [Sulfurimonas sp. SAG-AH-194-I05]|nr:peptidoglycan editing factor PgeF [Sulfurimonas sp. SAG-AH-194-I05]MDF1875581.1 peptidoglycan editing factor PgeF [Sulfurimonas sp. SAG-AH-194-I05]
MQFYHSKLLNSLTGLTHAFTTKYSGNLAFHVGDNPLTVEANHERLAQKLQYKKETLIHMEQIHSCDVSIVTKEDNFHMPRTCDALVTNKKNTPLMVMVADCSPILFYDKINKVIAVAHAGRQGAFKNIVHNTIFKMTHNFNTKAENILVSVGASIGVCCYEVGEEIYKEAMELRLGFCIEKREDSYYLNIHKILKKQLLACGILSTHIDISHECTKCNSNIYYSYRAKQKTGRFAGIIFLN